MHTGGDFLATTLNLPDSSFFWNLPLQFSGTSQATVVNLGDLSSTGGNIYLIGHSVQNAGSISTPNGTTGLAAGSQVLIADTSTNQKVAVQAPGGDVTNSGFLSAAQIELKSNGGNIYALAGNNGGQINATGTATLDGHVWLIATNGTTHVSGQISATNANGTGGSIETSGAQVLTSAATIKTGKNGSWLLDPDDLTIDSSLAGTIDTSLNAGTNVTEQTTAGGTGGNGNITVASSIAWTSAANLTLSAYRDITVNPSVTISNSGAGNLTLRADNTSNGTGAVAINGLIDFSGSTGNVAILYNPTGTASTKYTTPASYDIGTTGTQVLTNSAWTAPTDNSVSTQATAYMLVNNPTDLQNVSTNLSGAFALGTDIDVSSITNFTPIGYPTAFSGIFDGQNHTISNLTINDTTNNRAGLFGYSTGILRNLNLTGETVTDTEPSGTYIGGLVGLSQGIVANDSSAGAVSSAIAVLPYIGGLVGWNFGTVFGSSSSASVTVSNANSDNYEGGLVGVNFGPISQSYATGSVTVDTPSPSTSFVPFAGGLVGINISTITSSYATGNVTVGGAPNMDNNDASAGGLIGYNEDNITNTYATGSVTGGTNVTTGGLIGHNVSIVNTSYASGLVTAATALLGGGLFGINDGTVTSSYWDTQSTGQSGASGNSASITGATGEITSALQSGTLPTGFSGTAWIAASGYYPLLFWQERLVSGDVFNGGSPLSSVTVDGLANGVSVGSATTNSGGFYSFEIPAVYTSVLTFLPGTVKGNTFSDGDGAGEFTGMNIYAGALTLSNRTNSTYSGILTALSAALGEFSGANFLFTPNGSNITLALGTNLSIDSQTVLNLDQTINTSGTVTLATTAQVNQSQPITASALSLTGAGNFNLRESNSVGTLAANIGGNLIFVNSGDLTIGSAGGTTGVTSAGLASITSNTGSLTIASGAIVTANGPDDALQLSAGATFVNLEGSDALSVASGGGRWLVFSQNPANDTRGGLAYDFKQYNSNASGDVAAQSTGNGFLYTVAPVLTIALTGSVSKMYDGTTTSSNLSAANYSATGAVDGDSLVLSGTPTTGTYASANSGTAIGVSASGLSLTNLSITNGSATIYGYQLASATAGGNIGTINPALLFYNANSFGRTYGSPNPTFTGTVNGFVNGETLLTATTGTLLFSTTATIASNVGTYPITGSGLTANNGNYTFLQGGIQPTLLSSNVSSNARRSGTLTINPALLFYTASSASRAYGSPNPTFTGTLIGFVNGQTQASATTGTLLFSSTAIAASNVGSYAITGSGLTANYGNYALLQNEESGRLAINPAQLFYTADSTVRTYGGANPAFTGDVSGFVNGQTQSSATTGTLSFSSTATLASNVGSYAITGSGLTANSNYTLQQASGNASALAINPALLFYTAISASRTYGGSNPTFTGTVSGFVDGQTQASATTGSLLFSSPATVASNVGSYAINGSGLTANNGNYAFLQNEESGMLTINPALLFYTASSASRAYGSPNPTLTGTLTGFVNGQTQASATTGTLLFSSTATAASNVGSYAITGSGLTANYGNYTLLQNEESGRLTINPAQLFYNADSASRTYGGSNPAFTGDLTGFVNGQTQSSVTTGSLLFSSTASVASNVGSYAINGSGLTANSNYTLLQAEANATALTINPAQLFYTAVAASRTYGGSNPAFTGDLTCFVNGQTQSSATTGTLLFSSPATVASNVGSYAIAGSGLTADNGNYTFLQNEESGMLTINPAQLFYVANSATQTAGSLNTAFTGTVIGFVNGQTQSSATTGSAAFNSTASATSPAGMYGILGSGLTADLGNYFFSQAPANATALTIAAAMPQPPPPPGVTTLPIDVNNVVALTSQTPVLTASYTGAPISGINVPSLLAGLSYHVTPALHGPGNYQITATGTAPSGYSFSIVAGTLTLVNSSPATLPSLVTIYPPDLPWLLLLSESWASTNLLQPVNSLGLFEIDFDSNTGTAPATSVAALSQSLFFSGANDKSDKFAAGVKP